MTDPQELAKRPVEEPLGGATLGCRHCGGTNFEVKLVGSDTVGVPKRGGSDEA